MKTTKILKTKEGNLELSVEQMLEKYDNMIKKFAHDCVNNLCNIVGNVDCFEDYEQLGRIEAVAAFKNYDLDTGYMFSTYLQNALRYVFYHLLRDKKAKFRSLDAPLLYINRDTENGGSDGTAVLESREEDVYFEDIETSLEMFLLENLDSLERLFIATELSKKIGKAKKNQKESLNFTIGALSEEVEIPLMKKADLAAYLGLSRPTLNKRINIAMNKIKKLITEYYELKSVGEL